MLRLVSTLLFGAGIVSLLLGFAAGGDSRILTQFEAASIDGGQTFYCSAPTTNMTYKGCQECYLKKSFFVFINENNMLDMANIYSRCNNNSIDQQCMDNNYQTQPNPTCTKTNLLCGTAATAYTDNLCSQKATKEMINAPGFPTINCTTSYYSAALGSTKGVNCKIVSPGTLH